MMERMHILVAGAVIAVYVSSVLVGIVIGAIIEFCRRRKGRSKP